MILTVSGMSTAGKTYILENLPPMDFTAITSYTTRKARKNELEGFDYNFIGVDEFNKIAIQGGFLESVSFAGFKYGITRKNAESILDANKKMVHVCTPSAIPVLKKEAQNLGLKFCSVFIQAPIDVVIKRHLARALFNKMDIEIDYLAERIATSIVIEQNWQGEFNYIIPTSNGFIELLQELKDLADNKKQMPEAKNLEQEKYLPDECLKLLKAKLAEGIQENKVLISKSSIDEATEEIIKIASKEQNKLINYLGKRNERK